MKSITLGEVSQVYNVGKRAAFEMKERGLLGPVDTAEWLPGNPCLCFQKNVFLGLISQAMTTTGFDRHSSLAVVNEIQARMENYENPDMIYSQFIRVQREITPFGFQDKTTFYNAKPSASDSGILIDFSVLWQKARTAVDKMGKERDRPPEPRERKLSTKTEIIEKDETGYIPIPNSFGS